MATTLLSPGPQYNILQNVIYALPGSACNIVLGTACERSALIGGPFVGWTGGYNHVGGFIRCTTGGTTYKATKLKMKELDQYYASVVMADRPSYRWALDEVSGNIAVDSVGGANGTISGGVTLNQAGVLGKGMLFDGTTGKIVTTPVSMPRFFSVEYWIKPNGLVGETGVLAPGYDGNVALDWIAFKHGPSGSPFIQYNHGGGGSSGPSMQGGAAIIGQWTHIVWIFPGGRVVRGFSNGIEYSLNEQLSNPPVGITPKPFDIGWIDAWPIWTNGSLDEIAIYPYALTPAQIQSHYLSRFGVIGSAYASKVALSNPSNYWRLNETSGTVAKDSAGGADGTISGGVVLGGEKGMTFNGSTGKINISSITISPVCTVECWAKLTVTTQCDVVSNRTEVATGNRTSFGVISGSPYVWTAGNGLLPTYLVNNGNWRHIIWILNNTTITIYVDSVLAASGPILQVVARTSSANIGCDLEGNAFLNGSIDDVAIYPRALTPAEILDHYNSR